MLALGGLLFGALVYRYDMHEREPWWMLVAAVFAGALLMAGAFALEGLGLRLAMSSGTGYSHRLLHALLAGTLEELAKLAVPAAVLLLVKRHFNDPMDGLLYGSLAGLGAALFEGAWWEFYQPAQDANLVAAHGPNMMRLLMHTIWGGIVGFPLGLVVMKKPWRAALLRTVGLVMGMHIVWDFVIGFADQQTNWHRLVAAIIVGTSIVWYGLLVIRANKWSRSMHAPSSKQKLIGKIVRAVVFRRFK